ncbi:hypothetical protein Salat_2562600 [Sesamum alatum]|uniref:Uncharacterized protein n=1 Tax=Sesamum alatum TaxID=300844 RepID=A0AAE1XSX6_9LAMI|nr:hypothetical protein Salat_2562600 [Sesamum alatum]
MTTRWVEFFGENRNTFSHVHRRNDSSGLVAEGIEPPRKEKIENVMTEFDFPAFASVAGKVVEQGDTQFLQILERLENSWVTRYGSGGSGTMSTMVGSQVEVATSSVRMTACGVLPPARVSKPSHKVFPAPGALSSWTLPNPNTSNNA